MGFLTPWKKKEEYNWHDDKKEKEVVDVHLRPKKEVVADKPSSPATTSNNLLSDDELMKQLEETMKVVQMQLALVKAQQEQKNVVVEPVVELEVPTPPKISQKEMLVELENYIRAAVTESGVKNYDASELFYKLCREYKKLRDK